MGFLYKQACMPNVESAKALQCSDMNASWGTTTSAYTLECTSTAFTGTTMGLCRRLNGGTCTNYTQPFQTYAPCTYDGTTVSLDYFGAILGFLVIVMVGARLKRIFWKNHESI